MVFNSVLTRVTCLPGRGAHLVDVTRNGLFPKYLNLPLVGMLDLESDGNWNQDHPCCFFLGFPQVWFIIPENSQTFHHAHVFNGFLLGSRGKVEESQINSELSQKKKSYSWLVWIRKSYLVPVTSYDSMNHQVFHICWNICLTGHTARCTANFWRVRPMEYGNHNAKHSA